MNDRPTNSGPRPRAISRPTIGGLSLLLVVALAFGTSARVEHTAIAAAALGGFGERALSPSVPTTAARSARRSAPDKPSALCSARLGYATKDPSAVVLCAAQADGSALDVLSVLVLDLPPPSRSTPDGSGVMLP